MAQVEICSWSSPTEDHNPISFSNECDLAFMIDITCWTAWLACFILGLRGALPKPFLHIMSSDCRSLQDPCHLNSSAGTRRFSWGIFEVVYDYPTRVFTLFTGTSNYRNVQYTLRFLYELHVIAPRPFLLHILGSLLISVSPAVSLYLSYSILDIINVCCFFNSMCDYSRALSRYRPLSIYTTPIATELSCNSMLHFG